MIRTQIEKFSKRIKGDDYVLDSDIPVSYLFMLAFARMTMLARGMFVGTFLRKKGRHLFLGKKVILKCKGKITVGNKVTIQDRVLIDALSRDGVSIGDGASIGSGTIIRCSGNYHEIGRGFILGSNSSLADNCFVGATGGVWIGNDVIGGQNIRFHSSNHIFEDGDILIRKQGIKATGIRIGSNCWIGAGVVFCDGVTIGDGCVIGANSVVTKSFGNDLVIAGNPARVINKRIGD